MRRGPGRTDTFEQELLYDSRDLKITLQLLPPSFRPLRIDSGTTLRPGAMLVWYLFPGEWYEIGAFHHPRGFFQGHYVNLIRPVAFDAAEGTGKGGVGTAAADPGMAAEGARDRGEDPRRWVVDDLYLDVWVPAEGQAALLDEADLAAAVDEGLLPAADADRARAEAARHLAAARTGAWPPCALSDWPPHLVPALRLRRDSPGTFHAARASGRLIAYGLYLMGAVSATSIGFAAFTDAFVTRGSAQTAWTWSLMVEAILLLPLCLGGKLPATRWPRPALTDERSLFIATLASGLAVMVLNERAGWAGALLPVYGVLGLFSAIFAVCRARFDRVVPAFALAGLGITLAALVVLL